MNNLTMHPDPPDLFSLASHIPVSNDSIWVNSLVNHMHPALQTLKTVLMFQVWDLYELYRLDHEMYGYSPNLYLDYAQ